MVAPLYEVKSALVENWDSQMLHEIIPLMNLILFLENPEQEPFGLFGHVHPKLGPEERSPRLKDPKVLAKVPLETLLAPNHQAQVLGFWDTHLGSSLVLELGVSAELDWPLETLVNRAPLGLILEFQMMGWMPSKEDDETLETSPLDNTPLWRM